MGKPGLKFCRVFAILGVFVLAFGGTSGLVDNIDFPASAYAQQQGGVPGDSIGNKSSSDMWRTIRRGDRGTVSLPNLNTGIMIQSEGENWRAFRNGTMSNWGAWLLGGMLAILLVFFLVRGRIKVDHGFSGRLVERFNSIDRFAHWLTASSFVVLGLTGLNMLYGRYVIKPLIGGEAFSTITLWGKYAHNFLGFAFMVGIILILMLWVRDNLPNRHDLVWLSKAGGLFSKGVHPPARKFNAGQKILFWLVVFTGASLSFSGLCLLFPFEFSPFADTFSLLNSVGLDLPTNLTAMQEMQLAQAWHGILSLVMIAVILAHIYIGWIGMEGAYDAMGTGFVDENWARQHHNLWMEENESRGAGRVGSNATSDKPDV